MSNYEIVSPHVFTDELRKLTTEDRGHADTFNELFSPLINNDAYLKEYAEFVEKHLKDMLQEFMDSLNQVVIGPAGTTINNGTILLVTDNSVSPAFTGAGFDNLYMGDAPPENEEVVWAQPDSGIIEGKLSVDEVAPEDAAFYAEIKKQ